MAPSVEEIVSRFRRVLVEEGSGVSGETPCFFGGVEGPDARCGEVEFFERWLEGEVAIEVGCGVWSASGERVPAEFQLFLCHIGPGPQPVFIDCDGVEPGTHF